MHGLYTNLAINSIIERYNSTVDVDSNAYRLYDKVSLTVVESSGDDFSGSVSRTPLGLGSAVVDAGDGCGFAFSSLMRLRWGSLPGASFSA
jgi:hypothetical protein